MHRAHRRLIGPPAPLPIKFLMSIIGPPTHTPFNLLRHSSNERDSSSPTERFSHVILSAAKDLLRSGEREAVWKGSFVPLRERLDKLYALFALLPCEAVSNHFPHSLRPFASLRVTRLLFVEILHARRKRLARQFHLPLILAHSSLIEARHSMRTRAVEMAHQFQC